MDVKQYWTRQSRQTAANFDPPKQLVTMSLYVHRSEVVIKDGDGVGVGGGGGRKSEGSTADTARKRLERPWIRRQNNGSVKAVSPRHCAATSAPRNYVSTAVLGRVTWTMSVALLLRNNPKRKKSNFPSPAPPPCS